MKRVVCLLLCAVVLPGLLQVQFLHPPQDAVENVPLSLVVLVQRRRPDAHRRRNLSHGDGFIPVLRKQPQRLRQNFLLRIFPFHGIPLPANIC